MTPEEMAREIVLVRMALGRVAAYEGIVDVSPTARMVDDLDRDHEELEARIDAVMTVVRQHLDPPVEENDRHGYSLAPPTTQALREVARLLQGGTRIPDTLEGL